LHVRFGGLLAFLSLAQAGFIFYQNGHSRSGLAQACVQYDHGALKLGIQCRKPVMVQAGQHSNVWMPYASFEFFLQGQPFVVTCWSE
jgi:hypothetical protein